MKDDRIDDAMASLLRDAGPRPEPTPSDLARVQEATRQEWQKHWSARPSRFRTGQWLAVAAAVAAVFVAVLAVRWNGSGSDLALGQVARVLGDANVVEGSDLMAGQIVSTSEGLISVGLATGHSVRLDRLSRVHFTSAAELVLDAGAVYVDHEPAAGGGESLVVRTPLGDVWEIGTQFEVRLSEEPTGWMRVRVREGRVEIGGADARVRGEAGEELTLNPQGELVRKSLDRWDESWSWTQQTSPTFALDGQSLEAYIAWLERETGWSVRFDDPELEDEALAIVVRGSINGLRPDATLEVVLPGCGLSYRLENGVLQLSST